MYVSFHITIVTFTMCKKTTTHCLTPETEFMDFIVRRPGLLRAPGSPMPKQLCVLAVPLMTV